MTAAGENGSVGEVENSGAVQISEQDDREYRHVTLPNKMQVKMYTTKQSRFGYGPAEHTAAVALLFVQPMPGDPSCFCSTPNACTLLGLVGTAAPEFAGNFHDIL